MPYQQADAYRWFFLRDQGGIYLDPDQIILKSFKGLPLNKYKFIYSSYRVASIYLPSGEFNPIGVLCGETTSKIVNYVCKCVINYKKDKSYDAMGVLMMADVLKKIDLTEAYNAPSNYFYPIPVGDHMEKLYNGKMKIGKESYAVHWYGGHSPSQEFNRKYTEEFAKKSTDSISVFLRSKRII